MPSTYVIVSPTTSSVYELTAEVIVLTTFGKVTDTVGIEKPSKGSRFLTAACLSAE